MPDHWWKLNQSGSSANGTPVLDEGSIGAINGTLKGTLAGSSHTWFPSEDMGGKWTGALEQITNNSSSTSYDARRVELNTNPNLNGATKVSFSAWVKKYSAGVQRADQRIFSQASDTGTEDHVLMFGFINNTDYRFRIRVNGSSDTYIYSGSPIIEDIDTHICFVIDFSELSDKLKLYIDGALATSFDLPGTNITDDTSDPPWTAIGSNKRGTIANRWISSFNGLIADARLWLNKALTASEVSDVYNNL